MKFLVDEDLPRSIPDLLARHGHQAEDVRDVGLRGRPDEDVARYAREHALCLVTADQGFANIRSYPPSDYPGLVVLQLPGHATAKVILHLLESFLEHPELVEQLPGKLAIVEFGRVRLRAG
jgi:predicted nuclease of predicted toxin-antitoxin system